MQELGLSSSFGEKRHLIKDMGWETVSDFLHALTLGVT
jgi:hypothetical protein